MRKTNPKQYPQIAAWQKEHMKSVIARYKSEFVEEFKKACVKLGLKQSEVIREAMQKTIDKVKES